jgi:hypothetical protein
LEFNFQSNFAKNAQYSGRIDYTIEASGSGAQSSRTRISYAAIQVTLFDYYTYVDIQNKNPTFSATENSQDIVNVNLDQNFIYLYNSAIFSITSFRIRSEFDVATDLSTTN